MPYVIYQDCYSLINLNKNLEEKRDLVLFSFRSIAVVVLTMMPSQTMTTMNGSLILLSIMSWSEEELPHRS